MAAAVTADPPPPTPTPTTVTTVTPKTILGKYQLGRLLGRGSFAKVYHGRSIKDNQAVAIKVIDKARTDPAMEPRIVKEVEAMRRLDHPNVLRIHEVMATKTKIYLVMELAKGGDLFGKLARRPNHRFSEPIARRYFHQLVAALHYCHRNNVAHRDVKPQNLLLDDEGNVKLSDFGLSAVGEAGGGATLLKTACGTPAFAAPEIVGRSRSGYDGSKADAWSCGVILFVLLSGALPFDDSNLVAMYRKMHKKEFRFPSWVSRPARGLITKLLDPNPTTRLGIEGIAQDPWFKNQGLMCSRSVSLGDIASLEEKKYEGSLSSGGGSSSSSVNAFEIISMSSGLDLSGLFEDDSKASVVKREKRFTSREDKAAVVEKVVEVGGSLGYEVEKREKGGGSGGGGSCCVWLGKGRMVLTVVVTEVAPQLLVVEVKVVSGGGIGWDQEEMHWLELKSGLSDIAVSWHQ